jgi:hypothetical protein
MNAKKVLCYCLTALLGGCLPVMSIYPFYSDTDVVFDTKLLGTWVNDPNNPSTIWEFTRAKEPNNAYKMIFSDQEGRKGTFTARLIKLNNALYIDAITDELPMDTKDPNMTKWVYNSPLLIPAHTLLRVNITDSQLKLAITLDTSMQELLKEHSDAVKYYSIDDRMILISTTAELKAFVLKYSGDKRFFANEFTLVPGRAKASTTRVFPTKP